MAMRDPAGPVVKEVVVETAVGKAVRWSWVKMDGG